MPIRRASKKKAPARRAPRRRTLKTKAARRASKPKNRPKARVSSHKTKKPSFSKAKARAAAYHYFSSSAPLVSKWHDSNDASLSWQGALCYSPMGQTRWVWNVLSEDGARHPWVRFHFIQASIISLFFMSLYALISGLLLSIIFFQSIPASLIPPLLELLIVVFGLHVIVSVCFSLIALYGGTTGLPFIGEHAARIALYGPALEQCKL